MTFRNPRRETVSSHSEAPLGNSRCRASWNASLPASSSSERQYSGPVFSARRGLSAASIRSRTTLRSSFLGRTDVLARCAVIFVFDRHSKFAAAFFRPSGAFFASLSLPHGLRRGLHSFAATPLPSLRCTLLPATGFAEPLFLVASTAIYSVATPRLKPHPLQNFQR